MADEWADAGLKPATAAPTDEWSAAGLKSVKAPPAAEPEPGGPKGWAGYLARAAGGLSPPPNDPAVKDMAAVFMEGIHTTMEAPRQMFDKTGPTGFEDIGEEIQKQLRAAGASETHAKFEAERITRKMQQSQGAQGMIFGPLQAITAPILGPIRTFVWRPASEATGVPEETVEQIGMAGLAALGMRHAGKVGRVRVEADGKVNVQAIGEMPKSADFREGAELLGEKPRPAASESASYHFNEADGRLARSRDGKKEWLVENRDTLDTRWTDSPTKNETYMQFPEREHADAWVRDVEGHPDALGPVEANLRRAWEQDGIHPAEAVNDAQRDAFARERLRTPETDPALDRPAGAWSPEALAERPYELPAEAAEGRPGSLGAAATEAPPSLAEQPAPQPGSVSGALHAAADKLFDIGRDTQMMLAPMATGTTESMALAKDFANSLRRNRWEWSRIDDDLAKRFTPEQRTRMFNAMDEESVLLQEIERTAARPEVPRSVTLGNMKAVEGTPNLQTFRLKRGEKDIGSISIDAANPRSLRILNISNFGGPNALGTAEVRGLLADLKEKYPQAENIRGRRISGVRKGAGAQDQEVTFSLSNFEAMREHMGLSTLTPEERAAVVDLDNRQQIAWMRARDLGMVEGDGIPMHATRMVINIANRADRDGALALDAIGRNLTVKSPFLRQRKHLTVEETEAAAKVKYGPEAVVARDIRAVALSTAKLEDAMAGRTLVNSIREAGERTGDATIADGFTPTDTPHKWFTLDHPALRTWKPKFEMVDGAMKAVLTESGDVVFEQRPIFIRGDFEGPLRAVLSGHDGALYGAFMALKGKTMSVIMNSPMIHNAVEWGRALPTMPGKIVTFKVYFEGNRFKNDVRGMTEAIDSGLVPIGKRFFNQDINAIMEAPDLTPGRSWTAKLLAAVPGLFDEGAGVAVKQAVDKAGDFWHNTLLWDRIADLQAGLYVNFRDSMVAKGVDRTTAARAAAHFANRYAGALPQEAMSEGARKFSNFLMFSRSFTLGNLGVMKDMVTGLPKDVLAQIERDGGFRAGAIEGAEPAATSGAEAVSYAKSMARRKAMMVVAADIALMYAGNSLLQNAMNVLFGDSTLDKEMHGYVTRFRAALQERAEHPMKMLQPFSFLHELSATHENEPGRGDRIRIGYMKDGTAIYARNPVGKIGEEFEGYLTGPLDMVRRKLGTIARPAWQVMANDAGFGHKVYDPGADTPAKYLANLGRIALHFVKSQLPEGQISAASDLVKGEGDPKLATLQSVGPFAGVTFSKGAPGGPAVGELYSARTQHQFEVNTALPDIRKQILRGDIAGAQERMTELGIPAALQKFYVRTSLNPATRLSPKALKDFYLYATPEQRERMENAQR